MRLTTAMRHVIIVIIIKYQVVCSTIIILKNKINIPLPQQLSRKLKYVLMKMDTLF